MQKRSWIVAAVVMLAALLVYLFIFPETADSTAEVDQLLKIGREREQAKATKRKEIASVVRPAIPEIPEIRWVAARKWNLPLNNPAIVQRAEASFFLDPEDTVCGVLLDDHARAYPWYVLANYHVVNDYIGGTPVIVNLCEACNGGAAFLADTGDTILDFRPFGLKNGTWYGIDFQTGSYWYPFIGEAFDGPLEGTKLKRIRLYFSSWRDWSRDHPETTVVLSNDEVRNRAHGRISHMANDLTFNPMLLKRLQGSTPNPKRELLPAYELVFGLIPGSDSPARAYRLQQLQDAESPIQTRFADLPLLLFLQNQFQVGAYVCRLDGVELDLEVKSDDPLLFSDQLGNTWNAWGRTQSGPNHPAELRVADGYLAKWYEWVENFPDTELVGQAAEDATP